MSDTYTLFNVEASYYGAKIRAYLRHKQIPFEERLATREAFNEEILPRVGWPVIPVMVTPDDETLQDTSEMIDHLEAKFPAPAILPDDPIGRVLAYFLEMLGDEWLKMPALHYRWNHDRDFAIAEFGRNNDPDLPADEQRRIGEKVASRFEAWLEPLGVTARTIPVIEADYETLLELLDAHLADCPYLLGEAPSLADFAFHGPLYAHLYRDPNSGKVMRAKAPRVVGWVERVRDGDTPRTGIGTVSEPPPGLVPVLALLARDFVPILVNTVDAMQRWLPTADETIELPRHIGEHTVALGRGTAGQVLETRALFTYDQWMAQRVLAAAAAVPDAERPALRALFARFNALPMLDIEIPVRVERRGFRLMRAAA